MTTKSIQLSAMLYCIITLLAISCAKEAVDSTLCRTCTARMGGELIEETEACSSEAESSFERRHPYATVICR